MASRLSPLLSIFLLADASPALSQSDTPPGFDPGRFLEVAAYCYDAPRERVERMTERMEADLPDLRRLRLQVAGELLVALDRRRRLDEALVNEALAEAADGLLFPPGARSAGSASRSAPAMVEIRRQIRDLTSQLRALDISTRLLEAWLPEWRRCRDATRATADPATPPGPAPALPPTIAPPGSLAASIGGRSAWLRWSEYARFPASAGGREYYSGDGIWLLLNFGGDGRLSGRFEARGGANSLPVAGSVSGSWSNSEISGRWEAQPGRIARFRIPNPRFEQGQPGELVVRGRGIWCAPSETADEENIATGDYARFYGMVWGPAGDPRPDLLAEADRLCPNRGGGN